MTREETPAPQWCWHPELHRYSAPMPIRVIVAEDSLLVREGLAKLIEAQDGLELTGLCADEDSLLASIEADPPDVVLTDIRMPPTGTDEGIRVATRLRSSHPEIGVVVLSQYAEPSYALELLDGGTAGRAYLLKDRLSDGDQLSARGTRGARRRVGGRPPGRRDSRRGAAENRRITARTTYAARERGPR